MTQVLITSAALSDVGLRRKENQDNYLVSDGIFLVADGMGGGVSGQVASATTLEKMNALTTQDTRTRNAIDDCFLKAQNAVRKIGEQQDAVSGTTLTGLVLKDLQTLDSEKNSWYVLNVGDSRTYHLNANPAPSHAKSSEPTWDESSFLQITHDHSERQEAIDSGRMLPEVANKTVPRNIITQAIGSPNGIAPDYFRADMLGRFVICSDGIHSELSDEAISGIVSASTSPNETAHRLVTAAMEAGGHDNITVIIVDVVTAGGEASPKEWTMSAIGPGEDIDSLNDSTLETLRTAQAQDDE